MINPQKFTIAIQVIPRPRLNVVGKDEVISDFGGDVNNLSADKPGRDPIFIAKSNSTCFSFDILSQDITFSDGEVVKSFYPFSVDSPTSIFFPYPCGHSDCGITQNNSAGKKQCETEVRFTIFPKCKQSDGLNQFCGSKENQSSSDSYWEKIARRCFEPFKKMFKPVGHNEVR